MMDAVIESLGSRKLLSLSPTLLGCSNSYSSVSSMQAPSDTCSHQNSAGAGSAASCRRDAENTSLESRSEAVLDLKLPATSASKAGMWELESVSSLKEGAHCLKCLAISLIFPGLSVFQTASLFSYEGAHFVTTLAAVFALVHSGTIKHLLHDA